VQGLSLRQRLLLGGSGVTIFGYMQDGNSIMDGFYFMDGAF